jgi:flagella basal body P-ring formation protein FlgA
MTWFAKWWLSALVATVAVPDSPPAAVGAQVRQLIAQRWAVPSHDVVLDWGRLNGLSTPAATATVRLIPGNGDEWMTVVLTAPGQPAIALSLRAGHQESVLVAARPLARGQALVEEDIRRTTRIRWGPPRAPQAEAQPGWLVQRALAPGDPLEPPAVSPAALIRAGSPVDVVIEHGAVHVSLRGVALNDAPLGRPVTVRLDHRRGRITGVAAGPGLVRQAIASP